MIETVLLVPAAHPSLPGHFPGRPVVPGAVILAEVMAAAQQAFAGLPVTGAERVKFMAALPPGIPVALRLDRRGEHTLRFEARHEGRTLIAGTLTLGQP